MAYPIVNILNVPVAALTMSEAVSKVQQFIDDKKNALIATANAEMIMNAQHDEELCEILQSADLVVPDGAGTVWAAHHLGYAMPERVAGYDLVQELLKAAPERGDRVFFFGSAPGIAEAAKKKAEALYPGVQIVGVRNGYFTSDDEAGIIEEIRAAEPDILLAALGVPKQEKWLRRYRKELRVPVSIGVGGTLDVMAGNVRRAPKWMQKAKLEWLFRGLLQPKRAGRLVALPKFVLRVHRSKKK
ncbi:WecB/TagA/CpsF family glycosyltransferase [Schwartzia sp. (in: firmicutes)]|nr:WecB/TagA/CpsF family glycosyltransferase [Schwartzia sp. (in: firmicutes)]